ncbi:MAG: DUF2190 family protein [Oscillospiraceae bacterium]|nr:DUF2190 family protein [Oscillospiraceae bacterium]
MVARYNRPGENIDFLNTGTEPIQEGDVVDLGDHGIGVAGATIEAGAVGAVWVEGVFMFPKAAGALALGDEVYWNATAQNVTATGDMAIGWVVQPAGAADATALVKIG